MNLSEYLKDWRKRAGLSQPKAAAALALPLPTLRGIEQGRSFKYEHMLRLATEGFDARAAATKAIFAQVEAQHGNAS